MNNINPYLTFNGNCREAMRFYKKCLGGELVFQTVGESPLCEKMPAHMKKCIVHSTLANGHMMLMGSDMVDETGLIRGNAVTLMLDCSSELEIKIFYKKLSQGGLQTHPLGNTDRGALFGTLTDKYGNHWLFKCSKISNNKNQKNDKQ